MHTRHIAVWVPIFGLLALLAPACAATADSAEPEEDIDSATEAQGAFKLIDCKGVNHFGCMARCAKAGVTCGPAASHPHKPNVGLGYLFTCETEGRRACGFRYPNGDVCFYPKDESAPLCTA